MSAFLLISSDSQIRRIEREKKVRVRVKRPQKSTDSKSVKSSSSENSGQRTSRLRTSSTKTTSTASSISSKNSENSKDRPSSPRSDEAYVPLRERKKKVFDLNTETYVLKPIPLSPLVQKISEYEKEFEELANKCKYHKSNEFMNRYRKKSGELLFSIQNLNTLRYSYFEGFTSDYQYIQLKANQHRKNGVPKLKYMRKIAKITLKTKEINGLPSMLAPNTSENGSEIQTDSDNEEESDDETDMLYRLNKFSLTDSKKEKSEPNTTVNVRQLIKSTQLWNNVYQDIKFQSIEMQSGINYFEILPSIARSKNFYGELIDYFLYNMFTLSGDPTNLSSINDVQTIQNYNFFYFKDYSYEYINLMRREHFKMYAHQSAINCSFNTPVSGKFNSQPFSAASREKTRADGETHTVLINKIIDSIIENLKSLTSISQSNSRLNNYNDLFELWRNLLKFIMIELIINGKSMDEERPTLVMPPVKAAESLHSVPASPRGDKSPTSFSPRGEKIHQVLMRNSPRASPTKSLVDNDGCDESFEEDDDSSILKYYESIGARSKANKTSRNESISSKSTNQSIMSEHRFNSIASSVSSSALSHKTPNCDSHTLLASRHLGGLYEGVDYEEYKTTRLAPSSIDYNKGSPSLQRSSLVSPKQSNFSQFPPNSPTSTGISEDSGSAFDEKPKRSIFAKFKKSDK